MNMTPSFSRKRLLIILGFPVALTVFIWALSLFGIRIPCVFNLVTGLLCPGCGNTRAALSLLRLDFKSAFSYNLLFLPQFLYLAFVYLRAGFSYIKGGLFSYTPIHIALDYTVLIVVVAWGIIRNLI